MNRLRILAIICAYNEGDIIFHIIRQLTNQGIDVYLMDNCSTDNTVDEAKRLLGKGLVHIERFPNDSGYNKHNMKRFVLTDQLKRKEEIASEFSDYDWFIHSDADEIRESPWPDKSLYDGFQFVHRLGYNAINHEIFRFVAVDDLFIPGHNVRDHFLYFEPQEWYWSLQIKSWKRTNRGINLARSAGHAVNFPGRKVFPIRFLLLHYPIRGSTHGRNKLWRDRIGRYDEGELKKGWHRQYKGFQTGKRTLLSDVASPAIRFFDLRDEQLNILRRFATQMATVATLADIDLLELESQTDRMIDCIIRDWNKAHDSDRGDLTHSRQRFNHALAQFLQNKFDFRQLDDRERRNFRDISAILLDFASITNHAGLGKNLGRFKYALE